MTIQRFCVQEFLLDWWKSGEVLVDLQRWCLLVETFQSEDVVWRFVVVFQIVWWGTWYLVLILSQWKRFWVQVERKRIVERGFVRWRWLGVVCCVVLRWRWVVLTYARVAIQDCLNEISSCFFTNGSSEYWSSKVDNCSVWESGMLFLTCEITILGSPHMTWWCQCCRCSIHSYDVVLAIAQSNKSSGVPHSTARGNENWWGVVNTARSNESWWLRLQQTMSLVMKKEVLS